MCYFILLVKFHLNIRKLCPWNWDKLILWMSSSHDMIDILCCFVPYIARASDVLLECYLLNTRRD